MGKDNRRVSSTNKRKSANKYYDDDDDGTSHSKEIIAVERKRKYTSDNSDSSDEDENDINIVCRMAGDNVKRALKENRQCVKEHIKDAMITYDKSLKRIKIIASEKHEKDTKMKEEVTSLYEKWNGIVGDYKEKENDVIEAIEKQLVTVRELHSQLQGQLEHLKSLGKKYFEDGQEEGENSEHREQLVDELSELRDELFKKVQKREMKKMKEKLSFIFNNYN